MDIRKTAPGTVRQQLQAKVQFWLELRATHAAFGHTPVGNEQCTGCHARDQDSDPVHRFLEPRFFEARAEHARYRNQVRQAKGFLERLVPAMAGCAGFCAKPSLGNNRRAANARQPQAIGPDH